VLFAPTDVVLSDTRVVQPDLLFVGRERGEIIQEKAIHGAPDLAIEVLSPTSLHRDRHRKPRLYEESGVREFWLVDPANRAIEVFTLTVEGYELASFAAGSGQVTSSVLEGLTVALEEVFAG
jgi:Uma2 family endonuclease